MNKFIFTGTIWQDYRRGAIDPDNYGIDPSSRFKGAPMIKNRLIQDLHMLNKQELLIWDANPFMDLHIIPTNEDELLLDKVAQTCNENSDDITTIKMLYNSEPKLQAQKVICSYNPFDAPRSIILK